MNKLLETIYYDYLEIPTPENPLETSEISEAFGKFFTTYFGRFSRDEREKTWDELLDIISAYQERAFETGFYAGVELMK